MSRHGATGEDLLRRVREDGYFILRGALDPAAVEAVRPLAAAMLDEDWARIQAGGVGPKYDSWHSDHQHAILFPSVHCPPLAALFEAVLTDPAVAFLLERVAGRDYQLRADDVRRLSGVNDWVDDFQIPHNWHRDSPGVFNFGIPLEDVSRPHSGTTTVLRATHWQPYAPYWDFVFSTPSHISRELFLAGGPKIEANLGRFNPFNRLLKRRLRTEVRELSGKPGDVYFFLNDLWHGRGPNVHGERNIIARLGGFPTDFPFTGPDVTLPRTGLEDLPPTLRRRFARDQPVNDDPTSFLRELHARRRKSLDLYTLAWAEKKILARLRLRAR